MTRAPKGERKELERIRAHALAGLRELAAEKDFNRDWLEARLGTYEGDYEAALAGFAKALDRRYFDIGSAMCLASLGREREAQEAFRKIGFWVEGGSVEGHRLAGHAFLGRYASNIEEVFTRFDALDPDQTARLHAAAKSATKSQRLRILARLAHAQGRTAVAYKQVKAGYHDALGAEIALAVGDVDTARAIFTGYRKSASSSWYTPSGNATKAMGFVGSAAVAHAEEEHTRAIGHAKKALKLVKDRTSPTHRAALLVQWASESELGLESRTHAALRRAAPLIDVRFAHLSLDELETELDVVDWKRRAADEGDSLWDEDRAAAADCYERALGLGRKVRKSIRLGERLDRIAARLLYARCEQGELARAEAIARACIAGSPSFLNAYDVVAWCAESEELFAIAGIGGEWDSSEAHGARVTLRAWRRRPIERALRQHPATVSGHARDLVTHGLFDVALAMYDAANLARNAEDRFLAAWACWTPVAPVDGECPVGRRYTKAQVREAERAWAFLEPLIVARWNEFYQHQPFDPWVLAVQLLHATGSWSRLLEVGRQCSEEHWSSSWYRPANAGIAPYMADALMHEGNTDTAMQVLDAYLSEEPCDRRLLESADAIARRARKPRPSLDDAVWEPQSRARELSFSAWRLEVAGEHERAFEVYREASMLDLDPMALSNAANLLSRAGEFDRAEAYWDTAMVMCGEVHPRFRVAGFLAKRAWHEWLRERPADAIPLATHALELHPTAGTAHTLALVYRAIGDEARASAAIAKGLAIDSRHAELRALLS